MSCRPPGRALALLLVWLLGAGACAALPDDGSAGLLELIARADYAALSQRACGSGGLAFAPYARNLSRLHLTRLGAGELRVFATSTQVHEWGRYDGSGDPIRLTPMAYHRQFVWDVDYRVRARAARLDADGLRRDSDLSAVAQAFPGAEAVVYRFAGTERNAHKDARELILVGRPQGSGWCLLALAHSEDTV